MRTGAEYLPGCRELEFLPGHPDLVQETRLKLLGAFPTRIPQKQIPEFDRLLKKALLHTNNAPLGELARKKLALKTLNVAQRLRWLAVCAFLSGGPHVEELVNEVLANERRSRYLAEFLHTFLPHWGGDSILSLCRDPDVMGGMVRVLGRSYPPQDRMGGSPWK